MITLLTNVNLNKVLGFRVLEIDAKNEPYTIQKVDKCSYYTLQMYIYKFKLMMAIRCKVAKQQQMKVLHVLMQGKPFKTLNLY
jgi:hypothetical protein